MFDGTDENSVTCQMRIGSVQSDDLVGKEKSRPKEGKNEVNRDRPGTLKLI